jgi:hypothetical protein
LSAAPAIDLHQGRHPTMFPARVTNRQEFPLNETLFPGGLNFSLFAEPALRLVDKLRKGYG